MESAFFTHQAEICYDGIAYPVSALDLKAVWDCWHVLNDTPAAEHDKPPADRFQVGKGASI
ncbi:hypothetical protein [Paenibacillus xylanilyticus]|uniref:Uncharacterized protein n=1 Tax=Paenibacillus xylanilyticus TaxID=248903 RepID=A0A7Y6EZD5_9BACL|nr:hypothetical protein [Paenibacillus xylanilyticus]NUU79614.1 hypothetical protein [Paenibacillus xylanilyticus]